MLRLHLRYLLSRFNIITIMVILLLYLGGLIVSVLSVPKEEKIPIHLKKGDLIIFEGIHALNPLIIDCLPGDYITTIFVSVETTVFNCQDVIIPPREIRLARRMVRDSIYRNSDAYRTLHLWSGVMEGEDKYLTPFKDHVDYTLSTFHEFEPAILKPFLIPSKQNKIDQYIQLMKMGKVFEIINPLGGDKKNV